MGFFFDDNTSYGANKIGCFSCPLNNTCNKFEKQGSLSSDIIVILEKPSLMECSTGKPFYSSGVQEFKSIIPQNIYNNMIFTYAVRNHVEEKDMCPAIYDSCFVKLTEDVLSVKPKYVLGLGDIPLLWADSSFGSVNKMTGVPFPKKIQDVSFWYYPIYDIPHMFNRSRYSSKYDIAFKNELKSFIKFYGEKRPVHIEPESYYDNITLLKRTDNINKELKSVFDTAEETDTVVGFDIETDGTSPFSSQYGILTASLGTVHKTISFSVNHPSDPNKQILDTLGEYLFNNSWVHHSPYELYWMHYIYGEKFVYEMTKRNQIYDTMPYARIIHSRSGILDLGTQTRIHLGFNVKSLSDVDAGKDWRMYTLWEWLEYNSLDSKYDSCLLGHYYKNYPLSDNFWNEYLELCSLSVPTTVEQIRGLVVDKDTLGSLHESLIKKQKQILQRIYDLDVVNQFKKKYDRPFKLTSNSDIITLLKEFYNIKMEKISNNDDPGKETADEQMLNSIPSSVTELPSLVLDYRQITKGLSTYIEPLVQGKTMHPDGRIHPAYSTTSVITGRRSCKNPNIQNFPSRLGKEIRNVISAEKGSLIIACDYGQLEARVLAMASMDPKLIEYQRNDYDIHAHWRDVILNVYPKYINVLVKNFGDLPHEKLMSIGRKETKTYFVFASLYGASAATCSVGMKLPLKVIEEVTKLFWKDFAGVLEYRKKLQMEYENTGYVYNLLRTRRRGGIIGFNEMINYPIQSTASDIVRSATLRLSKYSFDNNMPWLHPILEIHDDLSFYIPEDKVQESETIISNIMTEPVYPFIQVPLTVEVSIGKSWGSLKPGNTYKGKVYEGEYKGVTYGNTSLLMEGY